MRKLLAVAAALLTSIAAAQPDINDLHKRFLDPPDDARMMVRWWWFGPAVTIEELDREMQQMKAAGIGGFEVQPVYPVVLDDPEHGIRNLPFLSDDFLRALAFTAKRAKELGLRFDLTLGSGWPFGGPHIPITEAAGKLRCDRVNVSSDATSIAMPNIGPGESFLAAFVDGAQLKRDGATLLVPEKKSSGQRMALVFVASRTKMMVKRPAIGAEGYVLDHMDATAVDQHLKSVGEPLLKAVSHNLPHAIFSDSLEVFASDWTGDFLEQFRQRRGYDLTPYLLALTGDIGPKTAAVRYDWGRTMIELVDDRYLSRITDWAHKRGTLFRSQTYGMPPVTLSSSSRVDLPEGEGFRWRGFSSTRWTTSAAHLYGRPVASSETWTWLHSPSFRATPLDMKAEADLHFVQGVNQLVGHGWPYSPEAAGEPGWRFYAAAAIDSHNPWWIVMPDVAKYMQRVSWLLRQGQPANDIALYLPVADVLSSFTAGHDSVDRVMDQFLGKNLVPQILDAGYNFDFIDDEAIGRMGIPHKIIVLPNIERMPLATAEKLNGFVRAGGTVVATRRTPAAAPGLIEGERDSPQVSNVIRAMKPLLVANDEALGAALTRILAPDIANKAPDLGFVHRKVDGADIYFVVNTSNHPVNAPRRFRSAYSGAHWWDGSGNVTNGQRPFAPYESRVVVFSGGASEESRAEDLQAQQIAGPWKVTFARGGISTVMAELRSWTADSKTAFYSGTATYESTVTIKTVGETAVQTYLSLGEGKPVPETSRQNGMQAWFEGAVREAALVYVNDKLCGSVWHPPYEVNITRAVHSGANTVRIVVGNTAINELAAQSPPDYRELNAKYGVRFVPQDMEMLQPLPSGLFGPVRLITRQ